MIDLIPPQYAALARIVGVLLVLALAAASGAIVNGWRLEAAHSRAIQVKDEQYARLADTVREQSHAVSVMQVREQEADQRRATAEKIAAGAVHDLGKRSASVVASKATDCDGVLRGAWE